MFVLMRDNSSVYKQVSNLFDMECIGKYDNDMDAFNDMKTYYYDAIASLGYADNDDCPECWCNGDEALVADEQGYGIALKIFEV